MLNRWQTIFRINDDLVIFYLSLDLSELKDHQKLIKNNNNEGFN